ncbi:DUF2786 domain-containing protein [Streptomyces hygroscopicus]|uniref:DUF2786 domain-containing protein n=1 Tax=Streptomyces hygroscopicus TaxID=1912 RepID=UPI001FCC7BE3|nr:DUF2786 domain-containing protein [Streptomyces hygroscopicus]BDH10490.1 hypothetical protein HOK021_16690 [Streptomyces hygroscopicus]
MTDKVPNNEPPQNRTDAALRRVKKLLALADDPATRPISAGDYREKAREIIKLHGLESAIALPEERQSKIRVTVDGANVYDAWVDLSNRWNGWLSPSFPLEEVRRLAEHTQEEMQTGYQIDTIHVVDGYQWAQEDHMTQRRPAAVVLHVRWDYIADQGPKEVTTIVPPDERDRYSIGGWEWTWQQVKD